MGHVSSSLTNRTEKLSLSAGLFSFMPRLCDTYVEQNVAFCHTNSFFATFGALFVSFIFYLCPTMKKKETEIMPEVAGGEIRLLLHCSAPLAPEQSWSGFWLMISVRLYSSPTPTLSHARNTISAKLKSYAMPKDLGSKSLMTITIMNHGSAPSRNGLTLPSVVHDACAASDSDWTVPPRTPTDMDSTC